MRIPRARITAPALHACLFVIAYAYWLLFERNVHRLDRIDLLGILWIADLPISAFVSLVNLGVGAGMAGHAQIGLGFISWGVLGTIWWYFLGISIEAWIRRYSKGERTSGLNG